MYQDDMDNDLSKRQRNYKTLFDSVTLPFIMSAVQRAIDFVNDQNSTSIDFQDQTQDEAKFLQALHVFSTKYNLYTLLPSEAHASARELGRALESHSVTFRVVERKGSRRKFNLRNVEIFKQTTKSSRGNAMDTISLNEPKPVEVYDPREMFLRSLNRHNTDNSSKNIAETTSRPNSSLDTAKRTNTSTETIKRTNTSSDPTRRSNVVVDTSWRVNSSLRNSSNTSSRTSNSVNAAESHTKLNGGSGSNYSLNSSGIQWKKAGDVDEAASSRPTAIAAGRDSRRRGGGRHSKLIEALSVPLDSDKATKMMQKMGWSGGALGARGEGITEPIMPALDLVSGAGFGHSPSRPGRRDRDKKPANASRKSSSRDPMEFRLLLLENLLQLLRADNLERDISLRDELSRKEVRFVQTALKSLNGRKNVGLNSNDERDCVAKLLDIFTASNKLYVEVEFKDNFRTITLIKTERQDLRLRKPSRRRGGERRRSQKREDDEERSTDEESEHDLDKDPGDDAFMYYSKRDLTCLAEELKQSEPHVGKKSFNTFKNRVAMLRAILQFLSSDEEKGLICFQLSKVTKKMKRFLVNIVDTINLRLKSKYSTNTEDKLYKDIMAKADCKLTVEILSSRQFVLGKKSRRRRTSPLKSTIQSVPSKIDDEKSVRDTSDKGSDKSSNKTKDAIEIHSDSEISLDAYEVYDINLDDTSSDESESEKSSCDNDDKAVSENDIKSDYDKAASKNDVKSHTDKAQVVENDENTPYEHNNKIDKVCDVNNLQRVSSVNCLEEIVPKISVAIQTDTFDEEKVEKSVVINKISVESQVEICDTSHLYMSVQSQTDFNDNDTKINDTKISRECQTDDSQIDTKACVETQTDIQSDIDICQNCIQSDSKIIAANVDLGQKETNLNMSEMERQDNERENVLSLCKFNNFESLLSNDSGVSVSIDIKMELNTDSQHKFTKEELLNKIENSSDVSIDLELTNHLNNIAKRSHQIIDKNRAKIEKKYKINHVIAKISVVDSEIISKDAIQIVQRKIFANLNENNMPLLKFYGIENNSIKYLCGDDFSYDWLKHLLQNFNLNNKKLHISQTNEITKVSYKMKAVLNSYIEICPTDLLSKIKLYNKDLKVDNWVVLDVIFKEGYLVFVFELDEDSYTFICDSNFSLYAGVDMVEFSVFHE